MVTTITTKQEIKSNGVYDLAITSIDGKVSAVKADVTAKVSKDDEQGGYIISAALGTIVQDENSNITISGAIPADVLPQIIQEFNEIINEIKSE